MCFIKDYKSFSDVEINVAPSYERGKNPFPKEWRMHAFMDALPVLNESCIPKRCKASEDEAYIDIIRKVKRCDEKLHCYLLDRLQI